MTKIIKYNTITALLLAVALLTACHRTELCYDHFPKAAMAFSWEMEWERDYGMGHRDGWDAGYLGYEYDFFRPSTPEWINLVKYKGTEQEGEHYFTPSGGEIVLDDKAERTFLFYNGDTEYIVLSDIASLSQARASATARSRASLTYVMQRHPDARSANPPDVLYAAFVDDVPEIQLHETKHIPVKMQPLVYTYVVRYEFEHGANHIALARGALGGMAESVYLRDGRTSEEPIIILYDCEVKDYGCEAIVRSFGVPGFPDEYYGRSTGDTPDRPFTLNLEVMLTNGKTLEFNYDVADQLRNQPRGGVITVSGIRIEDEQNKTPITDGFDVDLSGWGSVDVDLPLDPYHK